MPRTRSATPLSCIAVLLCLVPACGRRGGDPTLALVGSSLAPGDQVVLLRMLGGRPADGIALVVRPQGAPAELRLYDEDDRGRLRLRHRSRQGDDFRNLSVEDVNGDERDDVVSTWVGGHLEVIEVIGRAADGSWVTLFQNGGQAIDRRRLPGGGYEFLISSRTYEEQAGQPPSYETTAYRWDGSAFSENPSR